MIPFLIYSWFMCHSNDKVGWDEKWALMKFFECFRMKSSEGKPPNYFNIPQKNDHHCKKMTNYIYLKLQIIIYLIMFETDCM